MPRLIDATKLEEFYKKMTDGLKPYDHYDDGYRDAMDNVDDWMDGNQVEAEPVRHWQWVIEMDDMGWLKHTCPNCGYVKRTDIHVSLGWNYCPNCGCKMDGESDE